MTTYWHGGGRIAGDVVAPSTETGVSRSGDHGVFVTTDRGLAATYASTTDGPTAWVYEVEPVGPLEPLEPLVVGAPRVSFRCAEARIIRRFTVSNAERAKRRRAVDVADWKLSHPPRALS